MCSLWSLLWFLLCGGVLVEHYSSYAVSAVFCFVYVVVVNVVVC